MKIYGYSKTYGMGDHDLVKEFIVEDLGLAPERISVSNQGY